MSHTQQRALLRYNLKLGTLEMNELKRQITDCEAIKIHKRSKNISVYICKIYDTRLILVYNRAKNFFITCLPWSYLIEFERKNSKQGVYSDK